MTSSSTDTPMDASTDTSALASLASASSSHPAPSIPTPTTDTELYYSDEDRDVNIIGGDEGSTPITPGSSQQSNPSRNLESSVKVKSMVATSTGDFKGFVRPEVRGRQRKDDDDDDDDDGDEETGQTDERLSTQIETTGEGGAYVQGGSKEDRLLGEQEFDTLNEEIGDPFGPDNVDTFEQSQSSSSNNLPVVSVS